jgi:uncharacterized protein
MQIIAALLIGILFGLGILISGMGNPAKVLNFFDVAGRHWDPSLAFVMASALSVTAIGFRAILRRGRPILADHFSLPASTRLDAALLGGSALFGIGWGMTGVCPGGLLPVLANGRLEPLVFACGLVGGLIAARAFRAWRIEAASPPVAPHTGGAS